ncbi:LytTR family DNA-binding domain-containing protein [Paraflavitalea speifideaquila]|uniref:LytR/AlgR family response regulator transcription factor n=1 Tax=Paraflavitalea speifideaquila TaxID=3076558 RepID=UPI0028EE5878|nr:LytTR family DNA-binding domain-containing protein [Paraflavitalea speifideiaquila]
MAQPPNNITIQCLIADDEPIARIGMQKLVQQAPALHLVGMAKDASEISQYLAQHAIQLLFLDIQMPGINGIDYLKSLTQPPKVIFTTAYPEYAIAGYDLDVLDYLLKPITLNRFLKSVNKAQEYFNLTRQQSVPATSNIPPVDYLFVKTNRQLQKLSFNEILFIEAMLNYVIIHTTTQKIITYASIKSMQDNLPAPLFLKIHKSYIIATSKINSLQGYEVTIGTHTLPISRKHKDELLKAINQ